MPGASADDDAQGAGTGSGALAGVQRATAIAILAALSIVIAVLEATTLPGIPLPGVKYGLGNIPLLFGIGLVGFGDLVAIALLRIGIAGLLTGGLNVMNLALSIGGTAAALGVVGLAGRARARALGPRAPLFTLATIGTLMAAAHVTAQIALASVILHAPAVFSYLPVAGTASALTGFVGGALAELVRKRLAARGMYSHDSKAGNES